MKHYYVIPDIHGHNKLLQKALYEIYRQNPDGGKIIFLGDYIDRGLDNLGVVKTVMNPPENWEFVCLRGNHESMFLDSYFSKTPFYDFEAAKELAEFGRDDLVNYDRIHQSIDKNIVTWMDNLKLFHIEDKNVFVHAYYDDTRKPEDQVESICAWQRMSDFETYYNDKQGLYMTHGHTPRKHGPVTAPNRLNLDCGAGFYNRLVVAKFEKDVKGAVEFLEFTE
jgi:serine/threonine protein phosphatase 1